MKHFIYKVVNPLGHMVGIRITTGKDIVDALLAANKIKNQFEQMIAEECTILYIRECKVKR